MRPTPRFARVMFMVAMAALLVCTAWFISPRSSGLSVGTRAVPTRAATLALPWPAIPTTTTTELPTTTTTTTTVPPTTEPRVRAQAAAPATDDRYVSMEPCGGDLPPCYVKYRESHGDYTALNRSSGASGAWQFLDSTWAGYGGYSKAMYAPPSVQDDRAREVWNGGAGCAAWDSC